MRIGYFAMAGGRASATHIVGKDEKPICGSRMGDGMQFQFCGHVETALRFVECIKCRCRMKKIAAEIAAPMEEKKRGKSREGVTNDNRCRRLHVPG